MSDIVLYLYYVPLSFITFCKPNKLFVLVGAIIVSNAKL